MVCECSLACSTIAIISISTERTALSLRACHLWELILTATLVRAEKGGVKPCLPRHLCHTHIKTQALSQKSITKCIFVVNPYYQNRRELDKWKVVTSLQVTSSAPLFIWKPTHLDPCETLTKADMWDSQAPWKYYKNSIIETTLECIYGS